jgi:hypothetical protein
MTDYVPYFSIPAKPKKKRVTQFEKLEARASKMDFVLTGPDNSDPDWRYELYDNLNFVGLCFRTLRQVDEQLTKMEKDGRPQPVKPSSFEFDLSRYGL